MFVASGIKAWILILGILLLIILFLVLVFQLFVLLLPVLIVIFILSYLFKTLNKLKKTQTKIK